MKIAFYASPESGGHHLVYLKSIVSGFSNNKNYDLLAILPKKCDEIECRQVCIDGIDWETRKLGEYLKLMKEVKKILDIEKPDVFHIQCGDFFYRFLGLGLKPIKKYNTIITFHHMNRSFLKDISVSRVFSSIFMGVVHTQGLQKMLNARGINNVKHIEYSQLDPIYFVNSEEARDYYNLQQNVPTLAAIGGTRIDKGLDIFLEALKDVKSDFQLLIAGGESTFTKEYIAEAVSTYADKVYVCLKYLDDNELNLALNTADYIVLPYRKMFDGASGPLGNGVWLQKCVIGPNHGSLGDTIRTHHLGYTFESENVQSLTATIEKALQSNFVPDDAYMNYLKVLKPERFSNDYEELYNSVAGKGQHC